MPIGMFPFGRIKGQDLDGAVLRHRGAQVHSLPVDFAGASGLIRPAPMDFAISAMVVPASYSRTSPLSVTFTIFSSPFSISTNKKPAPSQQRGGLYNPRFHPDSTGILSFQRPITRPYGTPSAQRVRRTLRGGGLCKSRLPPALPATARALCCWGFTASSSTLSTF